MNLQKILIGTISAGICLFFLGWLIYGNLLMGYMTESTNFSNSRPMEDMVYWAMIASNLITGLLLTLVLTWTGSVSATSGAKYGFILGFLTGLAFDFNMHALSTVFKSMTPIIVDSLASGVLVGIAGAITALVLSKVGKA